MAVAATAWVKPVAPEHTNLGVAVGVVRDGARLEDEFAISRCRTVRLCPLAVQPVKLSDQLTVADAAGEALAEGRPATPAGGDAGAVGSPEGEQAAAGQPEAQAALGDGRARREGLRPPPSALITVTGRHSAVSTLTAAQPGI